MKGAFALWTILLLGTVFLSLPAHVSAQVPCGNIIAPSSLFNPGAPLTTRPVPDCNDPFGVSAVPSPHTLTVEGVLVHEGDTLTIPEGGTSAYVVGGGQLLDAVATRLFVHDGDDYRYVDTRPSVPQEADYRALAAEFFPSDTDIEPYIAAMLTGESSGMDDEMYTTLNNFSGYVYEHFVPVNPPLHAGTYTVVFTDYAVNIIGQSTFKKLFTWLIPTAHAQSANDFETYVFALTFTLTETPPAPTGISNILFLPGIQASRLYRDGLLGTEDQVWEPNGNQDVRQLAMTDEGQSIEDVYTRDIMDEAYGSINIYNGFSDFMDGLVEAETINEWKPFAYDWRYGVTKIAEDGTLYETGIQDAVSQIEVLADNSLSEKVTIIAHSNGGLLAKAILNRLAREEKTNLVDKIIFLASPQLGTPEAIGTILHGYDQQKLGGFLIDDIEIRNVVKNMSGPYGLLPTQTYFTKSGSAAVLFDTASSTAAFRAAYGDTITNESELRDFMLGDADHRETAEEIYDAGLANRGLLGDAFTEHGVLDEWVAPSGVEVIEVVGVGLNTVHQFKYEEFLENKCTQLLTGVITCNLKRFYKPKPQFSLYGDGTVMGYSAEGYDGVKKTWYVDLGGMRLSEDPSVIEHKDFGNSTYLQDLIRDELSGTTSTISFITSEPPVFNGTTYTVLGVHSPVTLEIVDTDGRRVGRSGVGITPQIDIPGSSYVELAGSTYIIVPQGIAYDVFIKGTGYGGMTLTMDTLSNDVQTPISRARVATVTPSTTISLSYAEDTLSNLFIDVNGDSVVDQEMNPQGEVIAPKGTYATLRAAIKNLPSTYRHKRQLLALTSIAEMFDKKSVHKKKFAKIESRILAEIEQKLKHGVKKKQLTQTQIAPILTIIKSLK